MDIAKEAAKAALDKKAEELKLLYVREVTTIADYFIICTGNTARQVRSIADEIDMNLGRRKVNPLHVEGLNEGRWVLMDYGDVVVHVFDPAAREYYDLEGLWSDAVEVAT
ncbi:MAG TPA: ribosome silencing factor [Nitrospirota bacterium]|jgi:ribosome-associated protein